MLVRDTVSRTCAVVLVSTLCIHLEKARTPQDKLGLSAARLTIIFRQYVETPAGRPRHERVAARDATSEQLLKHGIYFEVA